MIERRTKEDKPVLAICYDFDKTLSPDDMQAQGYIQEVFGDDVEAFWDECRELAEANEMDSNLAYMRKMVEYAHGRIVLTRKTLREYGAKVKLFPGVEGWFERIRDYGRQHNVIVEHYIISSGLKEMIEGTSIAKEFEQIYASSFLFDKVDAPIWPAQAINYTNKTQFLFRIEKGVLDVNDSGVNDYFEPETIRVPFRNIVYIGDSVTDIPCMKLVNANGGHSILMAEELAPLITPDEDEASAVRFDALMYGIELAYLAGKKYSRARTDLYKKVSGIASVANVPEIMVQSELINKILHTDYLDNAGINEFEHIRKNLRDLMKYIPRTGVKYITNFDDEILSVEWNESDLESDDLKNYKAKAEFYIRQHQGEAAIAKLKSNVPLSAEDVKELERILWSEVGSKKDYEAEYGEKPLGEFVREIVGLDMAAAKSAFAEYLNNVSLDVDQIYFVNQIIEYIVHNGVMKDMSVLQEPPFTDRGSIVEVFTDISIWLGIRNVIEQINANAVA